MSEYMMDTYEFVPFRPVPIRGRRAVWDAAIPMVLMYHSICPYEQDPYLVTVHPDRFARQMRWLAERGLRGVPVAELLTAHDAGHARRLVGLSFDDGYADFVDHALPILARYGFRATVFPIAGLLGSDNAWDPEGPRKPLMTDQQLRRIAAAGMEIGSHGLRHLSLPDVSSQSLVAEVADSRALLRAASGQDVAGFCYPYGHVDDRVVAAVRQAGYCYGCAIWPSALTGPHALPRCYIGDADDSVRLWAKRARHQMRWGHRSPARASPARMPPCRQPDNGLAG